MKTRVGALRDVVRACIAPAIIIGALSIATLAGYRLNLSESMPRGLWRTSSDPIRANYVAICIPAHYREFARERGYAGEGDCNGLGTLVKTVAARPGDRVELGETFVAVNGMPIPSSVTLDSDASGRPMRRFPRGVYPVGTDELWVISTHHPRSLDSRYFGPVKLDDIRSALEPIWVR